MARTLRTRLIGLGVVAVCAAGVVWWINRGLPIPDQPPARAPKAGDCFTVSPQTASQAMPWPGRPVSCAEAHTVEVYHVGQVDHGLIQRARDASGAERAHAVDLMYAQVHRACGAAGTGYLGSDWHTARVALIADWITPSTDGFFGCAVAAATGPAGDTYVARTGSLRGQGHALAVSCIDRAGDAIRFASCDDSHTGEFVGTYTVTPAGTGFNSARITATVTEGCGQITRSYLGLAAGVSRSDLHIGYVGPNTAATWLGSDQTFACYASADLPLRHSLRGLGAQPLPQGAA